MKSYAATIYKNRGNIYLYHLPVRFLFDTQHFHPWVLTSFVVVDSSQEGPKRNKGSVMKTSLDMESAVYISYL